MTTLYPSTWYSVNPYNTQITSPPPQLLTPEQLAKELTAAYDANKAYHEQLSKAQSELMNLNIKTKTAQQQYMEEFDYKEPEQTEIRIDFDLPSKISRQVPGATLHSVVMGFLESWNPVTIKKGVHKIFFVTSGPHRGTVGVMKKDVGKWIELDIFDVICAKPQSTMVLGDLEHDHLDIDDDTPIHNLDRIKVAKCQTIPITYSVVTR